MIKLWILPGIVIAGTALGLGATLAATDVNAAGYFAAATLYSMLVGAYIGIRGAYEDPAWRARRSQRRGR